HLGPVAGGVVVEVGQVSVVGLTYRSRVADVGQLVVARVRSEVRGRGVRVVLVIRGVAARRVALHITNGAADGVAADVLARDGLLADRVVHDRFEAADVVPIG